MNRREFSITVGRLLAAVPIGAALIGCEVQDEPQQCEETISANHGHTLTVPAADVRAGEAKEYALTHGVDHHHVLTVSADQMARLADGETLTLQTSTDASAEFGAHAHQVKVTCA